MLVVSALSALLFHWRVLPAVVKAFAWVLNKTMGLGGAVGVSSAVNVFVGMVEAPLVVKPYLARLSRSELFMVMVCGMATIAGHGDGALRRDPRAGGAGRDRPHHHRLLRRHARGHRGRGPDGARARCRDEAAIEIPRQDASAMDAVTRGTVEGAQLLIQIVAMLIVLIALVHLANAALSLLPGARRRAAHPAAHAGVALRPARLGRGRALGRGAGRRRAPRHEDRS